MSNLNLARKWRPRTFDEIIGQDLSISMLKNSLYLKKLFPVYLFSGQRGCGKTSTARVFGAALNCKELKNFQTNAKQYSIPCLTCESCKTMLESNHPDFIEMDAASHTGVDSVRQIIESCTYMPLSGNKKIYLIDEAHMLSKAAFNAFLKILEEPPQAAIFILATTELQKIPDTVRSRCFQVTFNPVQSSTLKKHLHTICTNENITIDDDALSLLTQENDGSVRDTLNNLEQVRFSGEQITKELVLKSLGKLSDTQLFSIINHLLDQNPKGLLENLQTIHYETLSAQNIWNMLARVLRSLLWIKHEVSLIAQHYNIDELKKLSDKCSINRLHALMQILWSQESLFLQTPNKHLFLETVLLQMCQQVNVDDLQKLITSYKEIKKADPAPKKVTPNPVKAMASQPASPASPWSTFLQDIEKNIHDPVLVSIFKQASCSSINKQDSGAIITLQLAKNSSFFVDKINESETIWKSTLLKHFPQFSSFIFQEKAVSQQVKTPPKPTHTNPTSQAPATNVTDTSKWPKASLLTKNFAGKIEPAKDE